MGLSAPCACGRCDGTHGALELARRARDLSLHISKADEELDPLTEEQALALSTALATWQASYAQLEKAYEYKHDIPPDEMQRLAAAGADAAQRALDRVTPANKARLAPIFAQLKDEMVRGAAGGMAPAAVWQEAMSEFIGAAYWAGEETIYTPYELHRLARTEMAIAKGEADREFLQREFDADSSAVDEVGAMTPLHPNCVCLESSAQGSDLKEYLCILPSETACEFCLGIVEDVLARIP